MSLSEDFLLEDVHPLDMVELLASHNAWEFDRLTEDQIAMSVEGQWRKYALTLAWSHRDETLRLVCTFEMDPPKARMPVLLDIMNRCNDLVWHGGFAWWEEQRLMVWRYGLTLAGSQYPSSEQVDAMLTAATEACERFYPAFQLGVWGNCTAQEALQVAIAQTYGRA